MMDIQSPADGAEILVAPDLPVALVVAADPVLVELKENILAFTSIIARKL
jgi:hypothetical protein